jgi:hypothetical protein
MRPRVAFSQDQTIITELDEIYRKRFPIFCLFTEEAIKMKRTRIYNTISFAALEPEKLEKKCGASTMMSMCVMVNNVHRVP